MKNALAFVAVASCVSALCRAAAPPSLAESLQACARMADVAERVKCYDAVAAASASNPVVPPAQGVSAPPSVRTVPPVTTPPAARTTPSTDAAPAAGTAPKGDFGKEQLPKSARPAPTEANSAMDSRIENLRVVGAGAYLVSLANGQTWREEGSDKMKFFRAGDDVRIEKGTLGSYQMWAGRIGRKNWVPVQRIQ